MSTPPNSSMPTPRTAGGRHFVTTPWTVVLAAARGADARQREALGELVSQYWQPLYGFIRRQGHAAHDAEDLLQGFLTRVVEKESLRRAAPGHGRFRNFLLVCLRHYLANESERARALKRGGAVRAWSLDVAGAEAALGREAADELTPQRRFDRDWAVEVLEQTMGRLAESWAEAGKAKQFAALAPYLSGAGETASYAEAATRLGSSEGAVKTAVYRLRQEFRRLLCEQVAATLDRGELLEDEIRRLFAALGP
jgi:RNA polymerase sigma factor (sigma-70 family)